MKYYEDFLRMKSFRFEDAVKLIGNPQTTKSLLQQYCKKGYIASVKRGLYVALNFVDDEPLLNKYAIASILTGTSFVALHSAFEYYGYANQVSYNVTVSSEEKFNPFEFRGFYYQRVAPGIQSGIVHKADGVKVSDVERTVIDGINCFENDMGFEELLHCIAAVPVLDEEKIKKYLNEYNKQFLYQKTGFLLEHFKDEMDISEGFLDYCRIKSGKSSRYLLKNISKHNMKFNQKWHLTVPKRVWDGLTNGDDEDADL